MALTSISRRRLLAFGAAAPAAWLAGCATPLPMAVPAPAGEADAAALLMDSAMAHGLEAYRRITDINIAYGGQWRPLIDRVQPVVVDKGYRGPSEERLMPRAGINAQAYTGPSGRKQVAWRRGMSATSLGDVAVWYDGRSSTDPATLAASALVAECYGLFLLGPLWLADRGLPALRRGTERVDGRLCDVVDVWMSPGLGRSPRDRVSLCIDRAGSLTRRVRFTLEGFTGTQGAVAETDTFDHEKRFGVMWPMRSYEEVVHPIRLPAHDWFVTGLDVNRGYEPGAVLGPVFVGGAAAPAGRA